MAEPTRETQFPHNVLVVDDEPTILKLLELALKRVGLSAKLVNSGEEAIAALAAERFGAVVTDKNLPGKSGLDVIREARALQPYCAIVMVTGYVSTESVLEALKLGANDYILKPFTDLMLVAQRVKAAMDHQRTDFERALLADTLRGMEKTMRRQKDEAFQSKTELDLFQSIVEVKIDDATAPLKERIAALEADVKSERERRSKTRALLVELADGCKPSTKTQGKESPSMFPEKGLDEIAQRLLAEAELLSAD